MLCMTSSLYRSCYLERKEKKWRIIIHFEIRSLKHRLTLDIIGKITVVNSFLFKHVSFITIPLCILSFQDVRDHGHPQLPVFCYSKKYLTIDHPSFNLLSHKQTSVPCGFRCFSLFQYVIRVLHSLGRFSLYVPEI